MPKRRSTQYSFFAFATIALLGCEGPCEELSKKICGCEINESRQQGCINAVEAQVQAQGDGSSEEQQACQDILDAATCDCEALSMGDWQACGLSQAEQEATSVNEANE